MLCWKKIGGRAQHERVGAVWIGVVGQGEGVYGSRMGTTDVARFITQPVMNPTSKCIVLRGEPDQLARD